MLLWSKAPEERNLCGKMILSKLAAQSEIPEEHKRSLHRTAPDSDNSEMGQLICS